MPATPLFTVIIPTYNRVDHLRSAINSVLRQTYEPLELIVVDNNCTDGTDAMVRELAANDPRLRYVRETVQGLNPARNRGLAEAHGELVAYFDDDELAPTFWLANLWKCYQETDADGVGGGYTPLWEGVPPRWLDNSECFKQVIGAVMRPRERQPAEWFGGGNCSYRRTALVSVGGFGEFVGYRGSGSMADGADVAVGAKLRRKGLSLWYEPEAYIIHKIPLARQNLGLILRRTFWSSYSDAMHDREFDVLAKAGSAVHRGRDACILAAAVIPGLLYGRLARLGQRLSQAVVRDDDTPPDPLATYRPSLCAM